MKKSEAMAAATRYMLAKPEIAELVKERYLASTPDIPKLLLSPNDSLGYVYADYINKVGLQAQPLLAQKWEEDWDKPLSEWRSELGINV